MNRKPKILLTNDDGIYAKGLKALWTALKDHAEIWIAAPSTEKSGAGLSLTLNQPLHIESFEWENGTPTWHISGTPADCVRMATNVILQQKPDLVVSGINKGSNSGRNLLYSGTVGGVIEASMQGIPGIAFSCSDYENPSYQIYIQYIFPIVRYLLSHPLAKGSFLNVTFPSDEISVKGIKMAKQGAGYYKEEPLMRLHPEGKPYYWMGGRWEDHEETEESDIKLLKQGYITVVPIQVQQLTDHVTFQERKEHFNTLLQL